MANVRMTLKIVLECSDRIAGSSQEEREWFKVFVLGADPAGDGALILHSNELGDELGLVRVLEVVEG